MKRETSYYGRLLEHYGSELTQEATAMESIEHVDDDPNVKKFIQTELVHLLKSPVLRELSEKLALKYGIDPKTARNSILKALQLQTVKVK